MILISFATVAHGQYQNLDFKKINQDKSISQTHILCMLQDSYGFLWVGTFNGLYRYDGYSFSKFATNARKEITGTYEVHALFEDAQKQLWIGTANGLLRFNRQTGELKQYQHDVANKSSISNNYIKCITSSDDDHLIIGTYGGGLNIMDVVLQQFTCYHHIKKDTTTLTSNFINTIFIDSQSRIWIGTEGGGINLFDRQKSSFKHFKSGSFYLPDNTINTILEDEKSLWVGTWNKGLFKYDDTTGAFIQQPTQKLTTPETVRSMLLDWNKNLWLANYGHGLTIYNPLQNSSINYQYLLTDDKRKSHQYLWSLYKDNNDIIWIGSFGAGLFNYDRNKIKVDDLFKDTKVRDQINELAITVVVEDTKGDIWLGTLGNGVWIYNIETQKLENLKSTAHLSKAIIRSIYEDRHKRVWVGTDNGLYKINMERNKIDFYRNDLKNKNSISNNGIYAIYEDQDGDMWVGIWGNGVNLLKKEEVEKPDPSTANFIKLADREEGENILPQTSVWSIREFNKGEIYFCSNHGLYQYNKSNNHLTHSTNNNVNAIFRDGRGGLWISTYGNGVLKYNSKRNVFESVQASREIISGIVYGISSDANGSIWLFCDKGLTRLKTEKEFIQNFALQEDLGLETLGQKAFCKLRNGNIIIGGEKGARVFNPEEVHEAIQDNPVYITDIRIFNKSIREDHEKFTDIPSVREVEISYKQNYLTFEFAGLNFSGPEKLKYAYKLEGFDEDWIYADASNRTATYSNLNGGKYSFMVRSMNLNGAWNKQEAQLNLIVTPPFWATISFKIFLLIIGLLIIALIIYIREKKIKNDYLLKNELLKSERLIMENKELINQRSIIENELAQKNDELTSSTLQVISKNQALSAIRDEIQNVLPQVNAVFKRKLDNIVHHISQDLNDENSWEKLNMNLNLIQDNFISRFAEAFPEVTHKDLKICAYIRMNISNEEIASLLNISTRSLEMSRYRIRKKINLDKKTQLNDFIIRF
jgi:ligand-binding sensor domain-containing protein